MDSQTYRERDRHKRSKIDSQRKTDRWATDKDLQINNQAKYTDRQSHRYTEGKKK